MSLAILVLALLAPAGSSAGELWNPESYSAAVRTSFEVFKSDYGLDQWQATSRFDFYRTKAGSVVRIYYVDGTQPSYADYICRWLPYQGSQRMECHEH